MRTLKSALSSLLIFTLLSPSIFAASLDLTGVPPEQPQDDYAWILDVQNFVTENAELVARYGTVKNATNLVRLAVLEALDRSLYEAYIYNNVLNVQTSPNPQLYVSLEMISYEAAMTALFVGASLKFNNWIFKDRMTPYKNDFLELQRRKFANDIRLEDAIHRSEMLQKMRGMGFPENPSNRNFQQVEKIINEFAPLDVNGHSPHFIWERLPSASQTIISRSHGTAEEVIKLVRDGQKIDAEISKLVKPGAVYKAGRTIRWSASKGIWFYGLWAMLIITEKSAMLAIGQNQVDEWVRTIEIQKKELRRTMHEDGLL